MSGPLGLGVGRKLTAAGRAMRTLADVWRFRRRYQAFRAPSPPPVGVPRRTLLVASLTEWPTQVKIEAVLARALQARGYMPVVATLRRCWKARQYFWAFGVRDFVFIDDFARRSDADGPQPPAVDDRATVRSLLALEQEGVDVGRHALSSATRRLRQGSLDLHHPGVRPVVEEALRRSVALVPAARALVETVKPDLALFLERGYTPYGELFDVLVNAGVDTIQWFHGQRSDALAFKRYTRETRDLHGFSLSPSTWERVRTLPWTAERDRQVVAMLTDGYTSGRWFARKYANAGKRVKTPDEVRRTLGLDPGRKTAVVFSHILWDATFFFGENLFDDYEDWLVETVKAACANPAVNWVVKVHPDYVWKLRAEHAGREVADERALAVRVGPLPPHVKLLGPDTDINTFSLFPVTDYCLTVRGTIGIEMPCFGVPVLTAGTGRYSGLGFTVDSKTRDEYLERLRRIQDIPPLSDEEVQLARKHAFALFYLRLLPFESFELVQAPLARLGGVFDSDVVIRVRAPRDLEQAPDLARFTEWAIGSREPDLLLPIRERNGDD